MAVIQTPCKFCPGLAVESGVCPSCGEKQNPSPPRTTRRRASACRHRKWRPGKPRYVAGETRRTDRCAGCGLQREVEVPL